MRTFTVVLKGGKTMQVQRRVAWGDTTRRVVPDGQRLLRKGGVWKPDTYNPTAYKRFLAAKPGEKWYGICGGAGDVVGLPLAPQFYTKKTKIIYLDH